jgi:8-oxo-dGTP pyrophosphatase MutT (NUDIX family)
MMNNLTRNLTKQNSVIRQITRTVMTSANIICQNKIVPVTSSVNSDILSKAIASRPFVDWLGRMNQQVNVMKLHNVNIQAVDMFGPKVGFIKFVADVTDKDGDKLPGSVFMRGGSVAVLPVIKDKMSLEEFSVLVRLNSVPTATDQLPSLPAGMIDNNGSFAGNMSREIKEEVGLDIKESDLIDLTDIYPKKFQGVYVSVGGTDEYIRLFAFETEMESHKIKELQGKLTGLPEEHEKITLQIVPLKKLHEVTPDMKALSALYLYEKCRQRIL